MTPTKASRNQQIVKAKARGESYGAIARRHGVTRERVVQIVKRDARHRGLPWPLPRAAD